jgi:hypothetical protein
MHAVSASSDCNVNAVVDDNRNAMRPAQLQDSKQEHKHEEFPRCARRQLHNALPAITPD